ncbi:MAG TPA: Holliday junction resolvase RuvX [Firmicutes bacterium]|nr:Holliday junction resolvase RuvX [Bacillota bacterium]
MFKPVLGLDLGLNTLGIAVSRSGHLVTGLANLHFPRGQFASAYTAVVKLAEKEMVGTIVLGRPCYPSGDPTEMTFVAEEFAKVLRTQLDRAGLNRVEIQLQDEQGSTLEAAANLHELGLNAKKQKPMIDRAAAEVILTRWLGDHGYDIWR